MKLWRHECCRVFADKLTTIEDKEAFQKELDHQTALLGRAVLETPEVTCCSLLVLLFFPVDQKGSCWWYCGHGNFDVLGVVVLQSAQPPPCFRLRDSLVEYRHASSLPRKSSNCRSIPLFSLT